jgi:hypothetical protein
VNTFVNYLNPKPMTKKTMTHTPANLRDDKAYLYGQALWLISQEETPTRKIQALNMGLSVGKSLHDFYINAGMLVRVKYGVYKWSDALPCPTKAQCVAIYKAQSASIARKDHPSAKKQAKLVINEKPVKKAVVKPVKKASKPKAQPEPQSKASFAYTLLKRFFPTL